MYGIQYGVRYRYAPETFWATYLGKPINTSNAETMIAQDAACGRTKAVEDELKRIVRKSLKKQRKCTIGFFVENSTQYYFSHGLAVVDDNMQSKLWAMKTLKSQIAQDGGKIKSADTATLNGYGQIEKVETSYDTIDLHRPVKIYFR